MDKAIPEEQEQFEHRILSRVARLHERAAGIFEMRGLRRQADEERKKLSIVKRIIGSRVATWCTAANREDVFRWQKLLRDHVGLSAATSADIAKNLTRSGRDLPSLARQKRWDIDGTTLMIGVLKIMKAMGCPMDTQGELSPTSGDAETDQVLTRLRDLATSLGVDEELLQEAKDFMLEQELEGEWAKYASMF